MEIGDILTANELAKLDRLGLSDPDLLASLKFKIKANPRLLK